MSEHDRDQKGATGGDESDALLDALTGEGPYREELETIPVDVGKELLRQEPPPAPPHQAAAAEKARMPLPAARPPRPVASTVRTAEPPAVNPPGPARREPFAPATSPAPGAAGRRAPVPSARPDRRPLAKPALPASFDDADIDAALSPLSEAPPPPVEVEPAPSPPAAAPAPSRESLIPPVLDPGPTEASGALDALAAVEVSPPEIAGVHDAAGGAEEVDDPLGAVAPPLPAAATAPPPAAGFADWPADSARVDPVADEPDAITDEEAEALAALDLPEETGARDVHESARPAAPPPRAPAPASAPGESVPAPRDLSGERPAAVHLGEQQLMDAWVARAEWFEAEAQSVREPLPRARLLLAASELWAMAGQLPRARDTASRSMLAAPSLSLSGRQARWLLALEGDWKGVAAALDTEGRTAHDEAARAHANYFSAEIHRVSLGDRPNAERRMELVSKGTPEDPRPTLQRATAGLLPGAAAAKKRPEGESDGVQPILVAAGEIVALRAAASSASAGDVTNPVAALVAARRAFAAGDGASAGRALCSLGGVPALRGGALLLGASLLAPSRDTRDLAIASLRELLRSPQGDATPIRRALAARALEQGDGAAMALALTDSPARQPTDEAEPEAAFGPADKVALQALSGGDLALLLVAAEGIRDLREFSALAVAAFRAAGAEGGPSVGTPETQALFNLGRRLPHARTADELKDAVHAVRAAVSGSAVGRVLALELDRAAGATSAVAAELTRLAPEDAQAEGRLAAALIEEGAGRPDVARRHYTGALGAARTAEAAGRALVTRGDPSAPDLLSTLAAALGDETTPRQALLLFEAAVRSNLEDGSQAEAVTELLERSYAAWPDLPFAARLAGDLARRRGDAGALLEWVRKQREVARDPVARALALVREAFLTADDDPALAATLVGEALAIRPDDVALRDLEARLDPTPSAERGAFRERIAGETAEGRSRAFLLYEAAVEYARAGSRADRERIGGELRKADPSPLTGLTGERLARGELQDPPREGLARLRALEQELLAGEAESELEAVVTELAALPDRAEAVAHAHLSARLRKKTRPWEDARELVQRAAQHRPRSLWVLREGSAHARVAGDDEALLELEQELAERVTRPLDSATLSLRAAEAAARLGKPDRAILLLGKTLEIAPHHLVARELRARLAEPLDPKGAAEDHEALARSSQVPAHRFEAWYQAALLWLDRSGDADRGALALEQAAAIDVSGKDVFERLQRLHVQRGDRKKLALLLEQRLSATTDPAERISLEVTRGRALFDVGDQDEARAALAAALAANPEHGDALETYAELCLAQKDWKNAEDAWIRLARVAQGPEQQANIYSRLAALYDDQLPNPARSEICHREILKRRPGDPRATRALIDVYVRLGDLAQSVQMQLALIERAATPDEKRDETLVLSRVHDQGKDKKGAFAVLEKARKTWPHDRAVLRALAEHHGAHGETAAQNVLLERASAEARRALAHGRFDTAFFGILETAAEVRGQTDAALVVGATLAALEGGADVPVTGAGAGAMNPALDDLLAPELLSPALRALLEKLPGVLDAAYPLDPKSLRAAPLPMGSDSKASEMRVVAESLGIRNLEVLVSPVVGATIIPACGAPARIIVGQALLENDDEALRYSCLVRALRMVKTQGAAFARMAPIELWPATAALLSLLAPGFEPQGVEAAKLMEARRKIETALPTRRDPELATLALEVSGAIGNRASQLGHAIAQFGTRTALLAVGSPALALRGVALALGEAGGPPTDPVERMKWVQRQPEARDLAVFGASEAFADARRRAGLAS